MSVSGSVQHLIRCRVEDLRWLLRYGTSTSYSLNLLDSKVLFRFFLVLLTVPFVFLVHVHDQLLDVIASDLVFIVETGAYTQM